MSISKSEQDVNSWVSPLGNPSDSPLGIINFEPMEPMLYGWTEPQTTDSTFANYFRYMFHSTPSSYTPIDKIFSDLNTEENMPKEKKIEVPKFNCAGCDSLTKVSNKIEFENKHYCGACIKKCCDCDKRFLNTNVRYTKFDSYDWSYICFKCLEKYTKCNDCGNMFEDKENFVNNHHQPICNVCDERYVECNDCGNIVHADYIDEDGNCDACRVVANHDYKPDPIFYNKEGVVKDPKKSDIYYGVELEVEVIDNDYKKTVEAIKAQFNKDFVYCKDDGSLDRGVEIVTHPASLDAHQNHWSKFFTNKIKNIRSFDTTTCGLHVHATRKPLSNSQISKIVCFVSEPMNRNFITKLAQRGSTDFSKIRPKKVSTAWKNKSPDGHNEDRYCAVNLCNKNTIEFRIFKGTLKQESFFKAIEFCEAIIEFCGTAKRRVKDCLNHKKFIEFILVEPKIKFKQKKAKGNRVKKPDIIPSFEYRWPNLAAFCKLFVDTESNVPVNIRDFMRTEDIPENASEQSLIEHFTIGAF